MESSTLGYLGAKFSRAIDRFGWFSCYLVGLLVTRPLQSVQTRTDDWTVKVVGETCKRHSWNDSLWLPWSEKFRETRTSQRRALLGTIFQFTLRATVFFRSKTWSDLDLTGESWIVSWMTFGHLHPSKDCSPGWLARRQNWWIAQIFKDSSCIISYVIYIYIYIEIDTVHI